MVVVVAAAVVVVVVVANAAEAAEWDAATCIEDSVGAADSNGRLSVGLAAGGAEGFRVERGRVCSSIDIDAACIEALPSEVSCRYASSVWLASVCGVGTFKTIEVSVGADVAGLNCGGDNASVASVDADAWRGDKSAAGVADFERGEGPARDNVDWCDCDCVVYG